MSSKGGSSYGRGLSAKNGFVVTRPTLRLRGRRENRKGRGDGPAPLPGALVGRGRWSAASAALAAELAGSAGAAMGSVDLGGVRTRPGRARAGPRALLAGERLPELPLDVVRAVRVVRVVRAGRVVRRP